MDFAEHSGFTNWGDYRSNWINKSNQMLGFATTLLNAAGIVLRHIITKMKTLSITTG